MGYCAWLTKKTGRRFRLPTEAEWALAASDRRQTASWNAETSGGHSHPVGTLPPNAAGLYDMVGNVWELCLEPFTSGGSNAVVRGGAWNSPPVRLTSRTRQEVRADAWLRSDPIRPVRAWWLTNAPFVGLRVASPADDGATPAARAAATTALTLSHLRVASPGVSPDFIAGLEGDLAYAPGNPPLDEVEVTVWFTDEQGAPQISDTRGKPAFGVAFPVLVNSAYAGPQAAVLHAGETRHFTARVPVPFDEAGPLPMGPPGGKVTWAGFAN
jgi:hypothetical protein